MPPLEAVVYTYLGGSFLLMAVPALSYTLEGTLTMTTSAQPTTATAPTVATTAAPAPVPVEPSPSPAKDSSFVANPAGLAPSGSGRGKLSKVDAVRAALSGLGVYGLFQAAKHAYLLAAANPDALGTHGREIVETVNATAAATVLVSHLLHAFWADNHPKPAPPAATP
jgi:hypothetical protein